MVHTQAQLTAKFSVALVLFSVFSVLKSEKLQHKGHREKQESHGENQEIVSWMDYAMFRARLKLPRSFVIFSCN